MAGRHDSCDKRHVAWPLFLHTYSALMDVLENELQRARGMPLAWFDVLIRLQDAGGRMKMQDLAESISLSRSGLTRLVDRMELAGYIKRTEYAADRRIIFATITAKGRREFSAAAPVAFAGVQKHFTSQLTRDELRALESALAKILRASRETQTGTTG